MRESSQVNSDGRIGTDLKINLKNAMAIFLDILFPERCLGCGKFGAYFCSQCIHRIRPLETQRCLICNKAAYLGVTHPACGGKYTIDGAFSAFSFASPIKEAIHSLKYRYNTHLAGQLAQMLLAELGKVGLSFSNDTLLMAVPLHKRRQNWRGFNQSELLVKELARSLDLDQSLGCLVRVKDTKPQVKLEGRQRQQNVFGAFAVLRAEAVRGKKIVLVDDMRTTGATLKNCAVSLKRAGASSVWGLTLAAT